MRSQLIYMVMLTEFLFGCSNKPTCTIPANIDIGESFIVPCDNGKAYQVIINEVQVDKLEVRND